MAAGHLRPGELRTDPPNPLAGQCLGLRPGLAVSVFNIMHSGGHNAFDEALERWRVRRIERCPLFLFRPHFKADALAPAPSLHEMNAGAIRRHPCAQHLKRRERESFGVHRTANGGKVGRAWAYIRGAVHASEHLVDVLFLAFEFLFGLLDARHMKAHGLIDILPGKRGQHQTEHTVFKAGRTVLVIIPNVGALQQRFDIADGMRGHLKFFHQPANDVLLESTLQRDVEDADIGVF